MPNRSLSRRDFLKVAGITLGATVAACSGLTALAAYRPSVTLTEASLGEETMSKRILVTYASKCGSTGEVARAIAQTLAINGARVDVLPVDKVGSLAIYEAIFVGSAIRMGQWLPEAVEFVSTNRSTLQRANTAFFTVCMTLHEDTPETRTRAAGFLDPVRATLRPFAEGYFGGVVDPKRLSFLESTILKAKGVPTGDFRDWSKIKAWAQSAYAQIDRRISFQSQPVPA
jgi:menaquinone-dependent protoporphyrinogen oxidase